MSTFPAIHVAAFWGHVHNLRAELAKGVSPDLAYSEEWSRHGAAGAFTMTPLHYLLQGSQFGTSTASDSQLVCLDLLVAAGANPSLKQLGDDWPGHVGPEILRTPLQLAVERGFTPTEFVARLLAAGADVNARASGPRSSNWIGTSLTALHTAAHHGSVEKAPLLIDAGANVNALSSDGPVYAARHRIRHSRCIYGQCPNSHQRQV